MVAVMGRECMSVLQEGTVLNDNLPILIHSMAHDALLAQGCTSWEEFSVELQLSVRRVVVLGCHVCFLRKETVVPVVTTSFLVSLGSPSSHI
jgi:NAD dependent epimerase/dehydratase family enzyme